MLDIKETVSYILLHIAGTMGVLGIGGFILAHKSDNPKKSYKIAAILTVLAIALAIVGLVTSNTNALPV